VSGISLKVDEAQKKLILIVPSGVSMIQRRAAERNARGLRWCSKAMAEDYQIGSSILPERFTNSTMLSG
jgi:cellulose synthase/poly-beta-1,6-N-acetylglucosamine synthase-like glycosyltransferase